MKKFIVILFILSASQVFAFEMAATIQHEYPSADISQYEVTDDGTGQVLTYWDEALGAQPSLATLEAAWPAAELAKAKRLKIAEVKAEGLSRIQGVLPAIINFDTLQLVKEMISSITPASRQLTANMQNANDIYQAGSDAVETVNGYASTGQVESYDVSSGPSWP